LSTQVEESNKYFPSEQEVHFVVKLKQVLQFVEQATHLSSEVSVVVYPSGHSAIHVP
jgi:hypothetical protein